MQKLSIELPGQDGNWGSYISKYAPDSNKSPLNALLLIP